MIGLSAAAAGALAGPVVSWAGYGRLALLAMALLVPTVGLVLGTRGRAQPA